MARLLRSLLLLFAMAASLVSNARMSYHHYYDSTTQWREYEGGWNGLYGYSHHYTHYFDGDTTIGSKQYYKQQTLRLDSVFGMWPSTGTASFRSGYIREDSTHKVWYYDLSKSQEALLFDYGVAVKPGDTFQYYNCTVGHIDSVYLGSMPLKRVRPLINNDSLLWTRGWVEGIGWTGPVCGTGIEGNRFMVCHMRQGQTLGFSSKVSCNSFLEPVYSKPVIHDKSNRADKIEHYGNPTTSVTGENGSNRLHVYPNPATDALHVKGHSNKAGKIVITDIAGRNVMELAYKGGDLVIPVSGLAPGCYQIQLKGEENVSIGRFIKQ